MSASRVAPPPQAGVAGFDRNQWQLSTGISGNLQLESVAGFDRNQWQPSTGIRNGQSRPKNGRPKCTSRNLTRHWSRQGSPRPWNWVKAHEIGCGYPVGASLQGASPPRTNASPAGQECTPRARPAMGVRSWRAQEAAACLRPACVSSWTAGYLSRRSGEARRRCPVAGRQQSWGRDGACAGHHRGLRAGHVCRGGARERGRAPGLLVTVPAWGTGGPQPGRGRGASTRPRARQGDHARRDAGTVAGRERQAQCRERGSVAV